MRGLKKKRMKRDIQTHRQTHRRTSRLYDRIGPVGRFDENYFVHYLYLDQSVVRLGLILLQSLQVKILQSVCRRLSSMSVEHMFEIICFYVGSITTLFTCMINSCVVLSFMDTLLVFVTYWKYFPTFTTVLIRACFYSLCAFFFRV